MPLPAALRAFEPGQIRKEAALRIALRCRGFFRFGADAGLAGVSIGVAALGAILEDRVSTSLALTAHIHSRGLAAAVSSSGTRAVAGRPGLEHSAVIAFVSGLNTVLLVGAGVLFAGAVAAAVLMRVPTPAPVATPIAEESRGT